MLEHKFMLTTSIAYGHFRYQERIEFEGIEKNALYGSAYVSAYLDNDFGTPKIQPGQCRILVENLPNNICEEIQKSNAVSKKIFNYQTAVSADYNLQGFKIILLFKSRKNNDVLGGEV